MRRSEQRGQLPGAAVQKQLSGDVSHPKYRLLHFSQAGAQGNVRQMFHPVYGEVQINGAAVVSDGGLDLGGASKISGSEGGGQGGHVTISRQPSVRSPLFGISGAGEFGWIGF